jgi:hypothetical protein
VLTSGFVRELPRVLAVCARVTALGAAFVFAAASASSRDRHGPMSPYQSHEASADGAPTPLPMNPEDAIGLWHSSFGAARIEFDDQRDGHLVGLWVYQRQGQEVIGYIEGPISGNVLSFDWEEPADHGRPPLRGRGYLVFDPSGTSFSGKWWSHSRDRGGDWNGWRDSPSLGRTAAPSSPPMDDDPYGDDQAYDDGGGFPGPNP